MSEAKTGARARHKRKANKKGGAQESTNAATTGDAPATAAVETAAPVEERVSSDESDTDMPEDTMRRIIVGPPSDPEQAAREEKIRSWLGRKMRVTVCDGRVYEGRLNCFDNQCNIILSEAVWLKPSTVAPGGFALCVSFSNAICLDPKLDYF